ncbi:MAG: CRISPR system precrRNA processing endoribonuclease RAMP protein Cas6 [Lachnospiraceae bacterium]|nr:CRISPR system precrRNA processing endoribonuclease RAMP protein Cas6 [Lachnospiraceae bacterium]
MVEELEEALQVQYIKLHFTVAFLEDTVLPKDKVSALRGGMGNMLVQANCISNGQCACCKFISECLVQRTIYSKYEFKPAFVTEGESVGYVLECENYGQEFKKDDFLKFNLLLFGKTIMYFHQFMEAFLALGVKGLGKERGKYRIVSVTNSLNKTIYFEGKYDISKYQVLRLYDYVVYRQKQTQNCKIENQLVFKTPLTLKYNGIFLMEYQVWPILKAISRRIFMLDCYEGIYNHYYQMEKFRTPEIKYQEHNIISVRRYSERKNQSMVLKGIKGYFLVEEWYPENLPLLFAGELIHIGKNTSFGFGRYRIK